MGLMVVYLKFCLQFFLQFDILFCSKMWMDQKENLDENYRQKVKLICKSNTHQVLKEFLY